MQPTAVVAIDSALLRAYIDADPRTPTELARDLARTTPEVDAEAWRHRLRRATHRDGAACMRRDDAGTIARTLRVELDVLTGHAVYYVARLAGYAVAFSLRQNAETMVHLCRHLDLDTRPAVRATEHVIDELHTVYPAPQAPQMRAARIAPADMLLIDPAAELVAVLALIEAYASGLDDEDLDAFAQKVTFAGADTRRIAVAAVAALHFLPDVQAGELSHNVERVHTRLQRLAALDLAAHHVLIARFASDLPTA